jgi:glycosyltransferase involved in cell wall biosynthesis
VNEPRVSVVLTVYNAAWCIERALDSVFAGTRLPHEVVVCDDGSSDGTADRVERRFGDRVRLMRLPHRNAAAARRDGIAEAAGGWIAFLDADDVWAPEKLERQMAFLAAHPEVRWACTDGWLFSDGGIERESWLSDYFRPVRTMVGDLFPPLLERCFPLMSSMMVERDIYRTVGGIDPAIVHSHDYDLWLRIAARTTGGVLEDRLVGYFTHPGQLSRNLEGRFVDDLGIMRRVASGALGRAPGERRVAAVRAAALEFDLGVACFRSGRRREARERMWRASAAGPVARRLFAIGAALAPGPLLPRIMASDRLKRTFRSLRRRTRWIGPRGRERTR